MSEPHRYPPPDSDTLSESYVITDSTRGGYLISYEGELLHHGSNDFNECLEIIVQNMDAESWYPDVYLISDHGNVSLIDPRTGRTIQDWV